MYECATCDEEFYWEYDCDEHMTDYGHWIECQTCTRSFRSRAACNQHMNNLDHWAPQYECETCNRRFNTEKAVDQHMDALDHRAPQHECETCDRRFSTERAADEHMDAVDHWASRYECETCDRRFNTEKAVDQHMDALDHRAQYECETCDRRFNTERAADEHMDAVDHWANYCKQCDRGFNNAHNLRMHMNSKIHRGKEISCPFCQNGFVTAGGASHHLERGACPNAPQMNRATIHRMIRKLDPHGTITNKQLEWHPEEAAVYQATNQAYNGRFWECYLCHRDFNAPKALNQHLNSPVHQQKIYHCLNRRTPCRKEFTTLAALFNHLESESCGFMRFENVQNVHRQVNDAIQGGRLLTGF